MAVMEKHLSPVAGTINMTIDIASLQRRMQELQSFVKQYMVPGEDYGNIPGTDKPTLLKSGAEKLCDVYGLAVGQPHIEFVRDDTKSPTFISYRVITPLVSRMDGRLIMHGVGSCNSHEKKYKWRWVFESELPPGINPQGLKTKQIDTRNGKTFKYQIPNDEIDDLDNTIFKMAKKRSLIDAVLSATRSSALFTQDIEDMDLEIKQQDSSKRDEQRQQRASQNQQSSGYQGSYSNKNAQARVYDLRTKLGWGWNDLTEFAASILQREIKFLKNDIKSEQEWETIEQQLINYQQASQQQQNNVVDIPDSDLPF